MKEDLGKFGFNKRDWKITPKTKLYDKNYDKIFRKTFCNTCELKACDKKEECDGCMEER
jgi:hypothetical protein